MSNNPATFPLLLTRVLTESWNLRGSTVSPGQTADGTFPLIRHDGGGYWAATKGQLQLLTFDDVRLFRAIRMRMQGGMVPMAVPRSDFVAWGVGNVGFAPYPVVGGVQTLNPIVVTTAATASAGGNQVVFTLNSADALQPGMVFSLDHATQRHRMYEITFAIVGGGHTTVAVEPPLRDDVTIGMAANFETPLCVMRLARPESMDFELSSFPFPRPTVSFTEFFYPP